MSNTFAGQSVYKDLEAAEKKIEQLQARVDVLQTQRSYAHSLNEKRQATIEQLQARLKEADYLIEELDCHEGAEGWSGYLRERLLKYTQSPEVLVPPATSQYVQVS